MGLDFPLLPAGVRRHSAAHRASRWSRPHPSGQAEWRQFARNQPTATVIAAATMGLTCLSQVVTFVTWRANLTALVSCNFCYRSSVICIRWRSNPGIGGAIHASVLSQAFAFTSGKIGTDDC